MRARSVPERSPGNRNTQLGGGRLKAVIWLLILAAGIYVCVKVVPVLVDNYELQDHINTIARFSSVNREAADKIREDVFRDAQQRGIPIDRDNIKVTSEAGFVKINVDYTVTVDLQVYQWQLHFHPAAENRAL